MLNKAIDKTKDLGKDIGNTFARSAMDLKDISRINPHRMKGDHYGHK